VDISEKILASIQPKFQDTSFAASDAEDIPFQSETFNCISCNGLLHHLYEHKPLFQEAFRLLKKKGTLYTDHDPNYFFNRFYRIFYKIKYRNKPGFGTEQAELSEYHNTTSPGINPEVLKKQLFDIGFKKVTIIYRVTERENWEGAQGFFAKILRGLAKVFPFRTLRTHFALIAVK